MAPAYGQEADMLVRLNPDSVQAFDDHPRPKPPRWSPLWRYFTPVLTQGVLFLYESPERVVVSNTMFTEAYLDADDQVAGGIEFVTDDSSWQYAALVNAGYTFLPVT